jgi:hypothetical protein
MNDKLQQIIDSSVISPCEEKVTISKEGFDWLIKQAEKVEQLQQEIKRLETEVHWTSKAGMRNEVMLEQKLQQAREFILETLELLRRGGPGTRSQVQALLEKVLEETK